ncbi:Aladin [Smittium mucronatum]|uniref:Aladin n=1 Tax=Smittium mucronatum TaxID=133383 RepID=A0A1R0GZ29_9FUNG|nr:Aladin [Smittium mucronatum]
MVFPHIMVPYNIDLDLSDVKLNGAKDVVDSFDSQPNPDSPLRIVYLQALKFVLPSVIFNGISNFNFNKLFNEEILGERSIETLSNELKANPYFGKVIRIVFAVIFGIYQVINLSISIFLPNLETRNKSQAAFKKPEHPIKLIDWHPNRSLLAIVPSKPMSDDFGRPFTNFIILYDLTTNQYLKNIFYSSEIGLINSISWQPNGGYTLAANGELGACLFKFVPTLNKLASSGNNNMSSLTNCWVENIYKSEGPNSVKNNDSKTTAFSSDGNLLILGYNYSQLGTNNSFMVVDPSTNEKTIVKRAGISFNVFASNLLVGVVCGKFSNDRQFLVTSHSQNNELRLWSTETWNCKVFGFLPGVVTNFCWFPKNNSCFFLVEGCRDILVLVINTSESGFDATISLVCSFESHIAPTISRTDGNINELYSDPKFGENEIRVGGPISKMAIDPNGNRLVIAFDPNSDSNCDTSILAVYKIQKEFLFKAGGDINANQSVLVPLGYIRGPGWPSTGHTGNINTQTAGKNSNVKLGQPIPTHILFSPRFEYGSLLLIAWSSGKVSFIPMIY